MSYLLVSSGPPSGPPESLPQPTSEELGNFQASLGNAVATWQLIELILQFVFQAAIKSPHEGVVAAVYYKVVNFRARLDMIDAAIKQKHEKTQTLEQWEAISATISSRSKRRNAIAHSIMYFEPGAKAGKRIFMGPSVTNPSMLKDIKTVKRGAIYRDDLEEMVRLFNEARGQLTEFTTKMPGTVFAPGPS